MQHSFQKILKKEPLLLRRDDSVCVYILAGSDSYLVLMSLD